MKKLMILASLAVVLSALVVTGCGGDDDESTTEATALTTEEFLAQGNEICATGNEAIDTIANDVFTGGEPSPEQLENFAELFVENVQGQIDAIRVLTPPEELAADVDTFLTDAEDVLGQVEDDPTLLSVSDSAGPFADVSAQAKEIGLTECANSVAGQPSADELRQAGQSPVD